MGVWANRVVPRLTDAALGNEDIGELREAACLGLHGRVLEIGFGSGLNLPHFPPEVESVSAVEPSDVGWGLSRRRRAGSQPKSFAKRSGHFRNCLDPGAAGLCRPPDPNSGKTAERRCRIQPCQCSGDEYRTASGEVSKTGKCDCLQQGDRRTNYRVAGSHGCRHHERAAAERQLRRARAGS